MKSNRNYGAKMKENCFLIHGSFGSPFVNWLPYLHKELRKRSKEVYTPDFPTGVGFQNYENWSKLLKVYLDAGLITEIQLSLRIRLHRFLFVSFWSRIKLK